MAWSADHCYCVEGPEDRVMLIPQRQMGRPKQTVHFISNLRHDKLLFVHEIDWVLDKALSITLCLDVNQTFNVICYLWSASGQIERDFLFGN